MKRGAALAAAGLMLLTAVATASPTATGDRPAGWQTWTWDNQCFAVLFPERESVESLHKDGAYLAIKHMPTEGTFDSVAIVSGREPEKGLAGKIEIDDVAFDMLMFAGTGFVSSGDREKRLLDALVNGKTAIATWTTADTLVVQTYNLEGLQKARRIIDFACKEDTPAAANPS